MPDLSARTSAKPLFIRRHVERKILCFSLWVAAIAALFAGIVYIGSALPNIQRSNRDNARASAEIDCAGEACDTRRFSKDWQTDQADYVIDTSTMYLIVFPTSTEEEAEHFTPLDYFKTAFIGKFRQPTTYNALDGEVWRLYSHEITTKGEDLDIVIGYAIQTPWKIVETPAALLEKVDAALKQEGDELVNNFAAQGSVAAGSRLGLSSDGFVIVDAKTGHSRLAGPWLPAFLPASAKLPSAGYRLYAHDSNLYLLVTERQGRLLAASIAKLWGIRRLLILCATAFLGMTVLVRGLSRRYLRRYFALLGVEVPTIEEALRTGEGQRVEFKRGLSDEVAKSGTVDTELLKSITAFANTNDGAILVGIDDAGHVKGLALDFKGRDAWERRIHQLVRTRIKPTPPIQVAFEELRGMLIGKISVARGEAPVYMLDGVVYLRQGSSDVQAQPDDIISLVAEFAF
jgi:hypothetical protein